MNFPYEFFILVKWSPAGYFSPAWGTDHDLHS